MTTRHASMFRSAYAAGNWTPEEVLAFHRARYGGVDIRMEESDEAGGSAGEHGAPAGSAPAVPPAKGYPDGVPIDQMTAPQRESYWRDKAQSWQARATGNYAQLQQLGVKAPEDVAAIKEKLERHDALEYEMSSAQEKAIADARLEAATQTTAQYVPQLVAARLDAAAARKGVDSEALSNALAFVDHEKFLNDAGEIDAAKVSAFVDGIAPAKGNLPKGPGLVAHGPGGASGSSGRERGLAEARKRFPELATK